MKPERESVNESVKSFLEKLGEPVDSNESTHVTSRVLDNLRVQFSDELLVGTVAPLSPATRRWRPFSFAAAAAVVLLVGAFLVQVGIQPSPAHAVMAGELEIGSGSAARRIGRGERIEVHQVMRTRGSEGALLSLADGSRVELSTGTELSLESVADGLRVNLTEGAVIVSAAKQRGGHLYVKTKDCTVSVVGTVFSVKAETQGSRVSVIEGEVQVLQGQVSRTLLPGQQISTNPATDIVPVKAEISWSRNASLHIAQLQQVLPPVAVNQNATQVRSVDGTVRRVSTAEGIAGIDVTLCAISDETIERRQVREYSSTRTQGPVNTWSDVTSWAVNDRIGKYLALGVGASDSIPSCRSPFTAVTDNSGDYSFRDIAPGQYTVRAQRDGYFGSPANGRYPSTASQTITVDGQQPTPEVSLYMVRGGLITGRVRDIDGKPVSNVAAGAVLPPAGPDAPLVPVVVKQTDDRGEFRLSWLPPGDYYIAAATAGPGVAITTTQGGTRYQGRAVWTVRGPNENRFAQTFHPAAVKVTDAVPITVREGEEISGIDVVLQPASPIR